MKTSVDFHTTEYVHEGAWGYRLKLERIGDVAMDMSLTPEEAITLFRMMRDAIGFKFPDIVHEHEAEAMPRSTSAASPWPDRHKGEGVL